MATAGTIHLQILEGECTWIFFLRESHSLEICSQLEHKQMQITKQNQAAAPCETLWEKVR